MWFRGRKLENVWDRPSHLCIWETHAGLNRIDCYPLVHTKAGLSEQGVCHVRLSHSSHQNMRELDLGADSVGEVWACLCRTAAPSYLHREAGPQNSPDTLRSMAARKQGEASVQHPQITCKG